MKKLINTQTTACGIFVFGIATGYALTFLAQKSKIWIPLLQKRAAGFSMPGIIPVIPDFDQEMSSVDVASHLGFDE